MRGDNRGMSELRARCLELLADVKPAPVDAELPPERPVTGEPRIGVFVCQCGANIASVVDVRAVVEALPERLGPRVHEAERGCGEP